MGESVGKKVDITISASVALLLLVYVAHLHLDDLISAVHWVANEWVTPLFDLDLYF